MDRTDEIIMNARVAMAIVERNELETKERRDQVSLAIADMITEYRNMEQEYLIMKVELAKMEADEANQLLRVTDGE
jgi:hypothetical protein